MNVAVRDMMWLGPLRRRAWRITRSRGRRGRVPAVPVTRYWEGVSGVLRGALIMASGLILAGLLGWGWSTLTDPHFLPVKNVQVQGSFSHVDAQTVRTAAMPFLTGNFLTMDVRHVQKVVQSLPWVRHAEVRRAWPDAVHITVKEQVPVAKWDEGALVNNAGAIFTPHRAGYPVDLPIVHGPEGSGQLLVTALQNMERILAPLDLHISHLIMDERRAWELELDNGMWVVLGRSSGYERLLKFVMFYRRAFHDKAAKVERVDLRYSNGFAVRWKQTAGKQK